MSLRPNVDSAAAGGRRTVKWYADDPGKRARQLALDLGVLLWCYLWVRLARTVHTTVLALQEPGRMLQGAGDSLAGGLDDAAGRVAGAPLIGDRLRDPLTAAANAGHAVASAGSATQSAVARLALLLSLIVALLPIGYGLTRWWRHRVNYAREAAAAVTLQADVDLLALRAAATLPLSRLARLGPDPVGRWRRGEAGAGEQLAALALRELGVRPLEPGRPPA